MKECPECGREQVTKMGRGLLDEMCTACSYSRYAEGVR